MSITVTSGGDGLVVTIEELLDSSTGLVAFAARAGAAHDDAGAAVLRAQTVAQPTAWWLFLVRERLSSLSEDAHRLARALTTAAEVYAAAERRAIAQQAAFEHVVLSALQLWPGRAFEETAVEASRAGPAFRASPPSGFAELAARIPESAAAVPQVRVEKYVQDDGAVHWVVYAAGTSSWSPTPGADPWDLTADVVGVAGGTAGSTAATLLALRNAGWKPGDPVVPVGHSQGGIVATAISTGGVTSPLLVTFGSPTRGVKAPAGTVDIAVEHSDDVVPRLGGVLGVPGDARVVVREAAPPVSAGTGGAAPHSMTGYARTAQAMDASGDERLVAARERLARFTGGKDAEVTLWKGQRLTAPRDGPGAIAHRGRVERAGG